MYMLLALAEKAGIMESVVYRGEEEDAVDEEEELSNIEKAIDIAQDRVVPKAKSGMLPKVVEEKIEDFTPPPSPSLLERPQQEESLLSKEEA